MTKAFKSTRFAHIPHALMDVMAERGGKQIVCVYLWLQRLGGCSDQGCSASLATIAELTGIRVKDVREALKYLTAEGLVMRKARLGYSNVYILNDFQS